jgi:hypothetical protein
MTYLRVLIGTLLVFLLSSCNYVNQVEEPTTDCTKEDSCIVEDEVTLIKEASVTDLSEHYSFKKSTLKLYDVNVDQGTDYVEISEFLELVDPAIEEYRLEPGSAHTINLYFDISFGQEQYSLFLKFNEETNLLAIGDYSVFGFMTTSYDMDYDFEFTSEVINVVNGRGYKEIDFDDYDFDIVKANDAFYIPFSIANLLLSGDSISVYSDNRDIYMIEDVMEYQNYFSKELDEDINEEKMMEDTTNYFRMLFDHFYGLESTFFNNGSSFLLDNDELKNATNIEEYNKVLLGIIYGLDDIHTSTITNGYHLSNDFIPTLDTNSRWDILTDNLEKYECNVVDAGTLKEYDDYYVFRIDVFTEQTKTILKEQLGNINQTKDIYIDLRCNTGGMIGGMYDLISYLTNDPFQVSYQMVESNIKITEEVTSNIDNKLDNQLIVITSGVTFSAGNIFTSIVKDNQLALIVGQQSLGGACPVGFTVLPNNMIITYSTNMMFIDNKYAYVEYGVSPDKYYQDITDISSIHQDLNE